MDTLTRPLRRAAVVAAMLLPVLTPAAAAQGTFYWNAPSGTDWTAANAWQFNSTDGPPATWVSGGQAVFDAGAGSVGVTSHVTAAGVEFAGPSSFSVGSASQAGASLTLTGGTVTMRSGAVSGFNVGLGGGTVTVLRAAPAHVSTVLALRGENTFTGNLVIGAGGEFTDELNVVALGATRPIPATATVRFDGRNGVLEFERGGNTLPNDVLLNVSGSSGSLTNHIRAQHVSNVTLGGVISGKGGLTFSKVADGSGNGVFRLTRANFYADGTIVTNGATLLVNNPLAVGGSGTGGGWVQAAGRVGGTGRIGGVNPGVNNEGLRFGGSGVVAPGDPAVDGGIGRLTVTNNVTWFAGGTVEVQLAGTTDTDPHRDLLHTEGALRIDSANAAVRLAVARVGNVEFVPGQTYTYTVAQADGGITRIWAFPVTVVPSFGTASEFSVAIVDGPGTVDYLVLNYTPVPEPAHVLAVCAAATGLGGVIRRLRRG